MTSEDNLIFISIAAYRDLQLIPTIDDLIGKAAHPERLRFGVCWQHTTGEPPLPYLKDPRFKILDVDWQDSRGACWARSQIMTLWQREQWFLQVDSHCRFAPHWDEMLIAQAAQTGSEKPILSTYGTPFTPGAEEELQAHPMKIGFQTFNDYGIPELKPMGIPGWRNLRAPMRARFVGAGFLFTTGSFVEEVGYDPELYFQGEEASIAVRAFTSGYDLFHPSQPIVWHDYIRESGTRHWDDHTHEKPPAEKVSAERGLEQSGRDWVELDTHSKEKIRKLLTGKPVESYGLGTVRTLKEYEDYAGLSFLLRKAQDYTRQAAEPPNPPAAADWAEHIYEWMAKVSVDFLSLPPGSLGDAAFWYVGIFDEDHVEIYRRDFPQSELATLTGKEETINLICEFQSGTIPVSWAVQPVSRTMGWLSRIGGRFAEGDYTILIDDEEDEAAEATVSENSRA